MAESVSGADRDPIAGETARKTLLLIAFAATMFLSGRLWSLREVREAQRAAGLAEDGRIALQAELIECRNDRMLQRRRTGESDLDSPRTVRDRARE